jgi:transaldolase
LLTAWDVRAARDILRPVYERTAARDGRVSIEVDPRIFGDADRTVAEARGLYGGWSTGRTYSSKSPPPRPVCPAITASLAEGISVNVTLIFSLDRYQAVLDAFLTALEQRKAAGGSLSVSKAWHPSSSAASYGGGPPARPDGDAGRRQGQTAELDPLRGRAALANARLAYEIYEQMLVSDRWEALAAAGARPQRLLWGWKKPGRGEEDGRAG